MIVHGLSLSLLVDLPFSAFFFEMREFMNHQLPQLCGGLLVAFFDDFLHLLLKTAVLLVSG